MTWQLVAIFMGGGLGSLCRFLLSWINKAPYSHLPYGTFAANFVACIVLGFTVAWWQQHIGQLGSSALAKPQHLAVYALFAIGFCGGFSTFSTFSLELYNFIILNKWLLALAYLMLSVLLCTFGIALGSRLYTTVLT